MIVRLFLQASGCADCANSHPDPVLVRGCSLEPSRSHMIISLSLTTAMYVALYCSRESRSRCGGRVMGIQVIDPRCEQTLPNHSRALFHMSTVLLLHDCSLHSIRQAPSSPIGRINAWQQTPANKRLQKIAQEDAGQASRVSARLPIRHPRLV